MVRFRRWVADIDVVTRRVSRIAVRGIVLLMIFIPDWVSGAMELLDKVSQNGNNITVSLLLLGLVFKGEIAKLISSRRTGRDAK